jgi:diguanylate cyclase (GGDEF)-like protein
MVALRSHAEALPFALTALMALFGCCWQAASVPARDRLPWMLLSGGLALWNVGMLLAAAGTLLSHAPAEIAMVADLCFFLFGVPVMLAICSVRPADSSASGGSRGPREGLFLWLATVQVSLAAFLTYRMLAPNAPLATTLVYPVEGLILAVAASLRLRAQPRQGEGLRFVRTLCLFLWGYTLCAGASYAVWLLPDARVSAAGRPDAPLALTALGALVDVLVAVPFLWLAGAAMLGRAPVEEATEPAGNHRLALWIDSGSSLFVTTVLVALGAAIARHNATLGIAAAVAALAIYGARTLPLQRRLAQAQEALEEAGTQLGEMSLKDGLTSIANRRCFEQILELEWGRAIRTQHPLSLLLIDVDYFRNLNDRYGHRYGDQCLVEIASALRSTLPRSSDLLARYGGEEFAVVLPETDLSGAKSVAERMQEAVRSLGIPNQTTIGHFATVSVGVSVYEFPQAGSPAALIEASDRGLSKAKQSGRDRVEHASLQTLLDAGSPLSGM